MAAAPAGRHRAGLGAGAGAWAAGLTRLLLAPTEAETRQQLLRTVKKEVGARSWTRSRC